MLYRIIYIFIFVFLSVALPGQTPGDSLLIVFAERPLPYEVSLVSSGEKNVFQVHETAIEFQFFRRNKRGDFRSLEIKLNPATRIKIPAEYVKLVDQVEVYFGKYDFVVHAKMSAGKTSAWKTFGGCSGMITFEKVGKMAKPVWKKQHKKRSKDLRLVFEGSFEHDTIRVVADGETLYKSFDFTTDPSTGTSGSVVLDKNRRRYSIEIIVNEREIFEFWVVPGYNFVTFSRERNPGGFHFSFLSRRPGYE